MQKIYANPFVLSPFYKPNHEDLRIQGAYDTALVFAHGAQEIRDAAKTLDALAARPANPQQQQEIQELQQRVADPDQAARRDLAAAGRGPPAAQWTRAGTPAVTRT